MNLAGGRRLWMVFCNTLCTPICHRNSGALGGHPPGEGQVDPMWGEVGGAAGTQLGQVQTFGDEAKAQAC